MPLLEEAIASGQVSADQIEAHWAAGDLHIVMFEPAPETVVYAVKVAVKQPTLREAIDGAPADAKTVFVSIADLRAALLDAERYRKVTYGKRHKYIWNHVLTDEERDSGHDLNAVLDAIKRAQS